MNSLIGIRIFFNVALRGLNTGHCSVHLAKPDLAVTIEDRLNSWRIVKAVNGREIRGYGGPSGICDLR
ncbi:MAG: hypothetical protein MK102_04460 [Fuerstiella sp.]|nr:hypothetical protein [Fuerstiella sp.]